MNEPAVPDVATTAAKRSPRALISVLLLLVSLTAIVWIGWTMRPAWAYRVDGQIEVPYDGRFPTIYVEGTMATEYVARLPWIRPARYFAQVDADGATLLWGSIDAEAERHVLRYSNRVPELEAQRHFESYERNVSADVTRGDNLP